MVGVITKRGREFAIERLEGMLEAISPNRSEEARRGLWPDSGLYVGWFGHKESCRESTEAFREFNGRMVLFCGRDFQPGGNFPGQGAICGEPPRPHEDWVTEGEDRWLRNRNGWFCGLLIDPHTCRVTLFNDRFGMQHCYLWEGEDALIFATDTRAILAVVPESRCFDLDGVAEQITFGCTLQDRTLFTRVWRLPAASLWRFERGERVYRGTYFLPREWEDQQELTESDFHEQFRRTMLDVVPRYRGIPNTAGLSLTGGWDSRMILAALDARPGELPCHTFCGDEGETRDVALARAIAAVAAQPHRALQLDQDFFDNFNSLAEETVRLTGGLCGLWDAHEIFLNRKLQAANRVRVTGNFGSELIREVSGFKDLGLDGSCVVPEFLPHMAQARATMAESRCPHPVTFAAFREIPWRLWGTVRCASSQIVFQTPYMDNELVALLYRAPSKLRSGAAVPQRFVEAVDPRLAKLPTDRGPSATAGRLLGAVQRLSGRVSFKADYWLSEGMPSPLIPYENRLRATARSLFPKSHKYLQYRAWFRGRLLEQICELHSAMSTPPPFLNPLFCRQALARHLSGEGNYLGELNMILSLGLVDSALLRVA